MLGKFKIFIAGLSVLIGMAILLLPQLPVLLKASEGYTYYFDETTANEACKKAPIRVTAIRDTIDAAKIYKAPPLEYVSITEYCGTVTIYWTGIVARSLISLCVAIAASVAYARRKYPEASIYIYSVIYSVLVVLYTGLNVSNWVYEMIQRQQIHPALFLSRPTVVLFESLMIFTILLLGLRRWYKHWTFYAALVIFYPLSNIAALLVALLFDVTGMGSFGTIITTPVISAITPGLGALIYRKYLTPLLLSRGIIK